VPGVGSPRPPEIWHRILQRLSAAFLLEAVVTGAILYGTERTPYGFFGVVEWLHVLLGWAAVPVFLAYQLVHVSARWSWAPLRQRGSGLVAVLTGAVLVATGIDLVLPWSPLPVSAARQAHLVATLGIAVALAVHAGPALLRGWRQRRALRLAGRQLRRPGEQSA
jgi:hypothetical protein